MDPNPLTALRGFSVFCSLVCCAAKKKQSQKPSWTVTGWLWWKSTDNAEGRKAILGRLQADSNGRSLAHVDRQVHDPVGALRLGFSPLAHHLVVTERDRGRVRMRCRGALARHRVAKIRKG